MLPESSLRQLKKLRKEVKGKDINDKVSKDETKLPNVFWMDNPVDGGRIQSYDDYTKTDNKKQTTAFKSKLVNKPLVNQQLSENKKQYEKMELKNLLGIKEFDIKNKIKSNKKLSKNFLNEGVDEKGLYLIYSEDSEMAELYRGKFNSEEKAWEKAEKIYVEKNQEIEHYDVVGPFDSNEEINSWLASYDVDIPRDLALEKVNEEFTGGVDAEKDSGNLFGFAQYKEPTIKKIGSFTSFTKMINPPTPKERPVLNAGQFIDNDKVQGYVNRIEGNKVFVESLENPGEIIEVSLKDAVKIRKEVKEHTVTKKIDK